MDWPTEAMGEEKWREAIAHVAATGDPLERALWGLRFYATATPYDLDFDGDGAAKPSVAGYAIACVRGEAKDIPLD